MRTKPRRPLLGCVFALVSALTLSSCATSHLFRWSAGKPSLYGQPDGEFMQSLVHPIGTIAALPLTLVWDVATFPGQLIWRVHPYGHNTSPATATDS
jgi:hypothetical protein